MDRIVSRHAVEDESCSHLSTILWIGLWPEAEDGVAAFRRLRSVDLPPRTQQLDGTACYPSAYEEAQSRDGMSPKTINEFWFEYMPRAREMFLGGAPVDCEADPLLATFYDIFGVIDACVAEALQKGYTHFTPTTRTNRDKTKRTVLVFSGGPLPAMSRQVPFQQERIKALRFGFPGSEFIDLKIVLQSMIASEGKIEPK